MASSNWLQSINMLPSLTELQLSHCSLNSIPSLSHVNFTSLEVLGLLWNHISSPFPNWISDLTSLKKLKLSNNNFGGTIPIAIGGLTSLTELNLGDNEFEGKVPRILGNLCNLQTLILSGNKLNGDLSEFFQNFSRCTKDSLEWLDLADNQFSGSVPSSIGSYSLLQLLDLSDNSFEGNIDESFFANFTNLKTLAIDSVVLKLRPDWIPPFHLKSLSLSNCHLGPRFPKWLPTQKQLTSLDLSNNEMSGTVPTWFWNMSSHFSYLDLSYNHLSGQLPYLSINGGIFLQSNMFKGQLPRISPNITALDLSNNLISGPISLLLCNTMNKMRLQFLNLSGNTLSGELPECWSNLEFLIYVSLESNNITGKIPNSMGSLPSLVSLHLRNNSMSGELPASLRNCVWLVTIDLGENGFTGSIPKWIGQSLRKLRFLRLRSNKFTGGIPQEICKNLSSLQVLDLAHNSLSGTIPRCFKNFTAMASKQNGSALSFYVDHINLVTETASIVTKGKELQYSSTLRLVTSMDLSKNNLSGVIPAELTTLLSLRSLNLSNNHFEGKIPEKIGQMSLLESLDFSHNKLSGLIPQSMANLTFLNHLNLSFNNLSGEIPLSAQLQSFSLESYMSNPELCGLPLERCNEEARQPPNNGENAEDDDDNEDWMEMKWFYVSLPLGLATGFWGFMGVLLLKKSWRFAYFRFIGDMIEKFYRP